MKAIHRTALMLAISLSLTTCDNATVFDRYHNLPPEGWERNDTLLFTIAPAGRSGIFHEEAGVRIHAGYPYTNMTLAIEQRILPSGWHRTDTLRCKLADSRGQLRGSGMAYHQYSFHITDIRMAKDDTLLIAVHHVMRRETLPGVTDIGIRMTQTEASDE